jgi:hypothetical protein
MYADQKGMVELVCEDGSSLLQDTLYVPGLGVNLVSARKICQAGLNSAFNRNTMYFKQGNRKVISAKMHQGLYIVHHVDKALAETAVASVEASNDCEMATLPPKEIRTTNSRQELRKELPLSSSSGIEVRSSRTRNDSESPQGHDTWQAYSNPIK